MRKDFANVMNDCLVISAVGLNIKLELRSRLFQFHKLMMLQDLLHIIQLFPRIYLLAMMMTTLMMLLHLIQQSDSNQREMHGLIMVVPIMVQFWVTVQLLHLQYLLVLRRM
jgi:hypothetical protein